jgi:uncharacterized membrane protein YkvA (DUF1232 family)
VLDKLSPGQKKAFIVGCTILYILSPVDLIPDFLVGPGQLDDLGVLFYCVKTLFTNPSPPKLD